MENKANKHLAVKPVENNSKEDTAVHSEHPSTNTPKVATDDEILCCGGCGCYGMSSEFLNTEACSSACQVSL